MQVSNAAASPTLTQTDASGSTTSNSPESAASDTPTTSVSSPAASPSQDAAVNISPEGAAISAQDASSTQSNASNSDDSGGTTDVSPLKSLTYGTLGLERPDQSQDNRNPFYTAGRWLAAGLTIGGIISLLI
jgi:hypothetical protein